MAAYKHVHTERTPEISPSQQTPSAQPRHPDDASSNAHAALLKKVRGLLDANKPKEALDLVNGRGSGDPVLRNARGVCLMRMNEPGLAVRALREITLGSGGFVLRNDAPAMYKLNFATALLLSGNVSGCVGILDEISDDANPRVQQLRSAIQHWKKELTFGQRLAWRFGLDPKHPVRIDFPLGEL